MKFKKAIYYPSLIIAIAGGIYFGLFSCGGYEIYHKSFWVLFYIILFVTLFIISKNKIRSHSVRSVIYFILLWIIIVHGIYFVSEASAASFYPDSPHSMGEFWKRFTNAFLNNPC